jgi:hypothetical protein
MVVLLNGGRPMDNIPATRRNEARVNHVPKAAGFTT